MFVFGEILENHQTRVVSQTMTIVMGGVWRIAPKHGGNMSSNFWELGCTARFSAHCCNVSTEHPRWAVVKDW